jgi:alpha-D-ribose 1-methylphosphonate 5-triphosphate synthase subunit PhnH
MSAVAVARGFADPVLDSQSVFRTVMMALARPGTIAELATGQLLPPAPLTPELAAVALTLCDHETPSSRPARRWPMTPPRPGSRLPSI